MHHNAPQCTSMVCKHSCGLYAFCNVSAMHSNGQQAFTAFTQCTAMHHNAQQAFCNVWQATATFTQCIKYTAMHRNGPQVFHNIPQYSTTHHKAPQWSASLPQHFCKTPQCTATHRSLSVCRSAFGILAKRLSGSRCRWDGGWVGSAICVLNFGGNHRRGRDSFGRGKFGTFHCN